MATPRISVIIPLYNKEQEIEGTVRSILAQTLQPLEIVIINDGSTDRSAEIVRSISSPLIRLITQSNRGECAARNHAIEEAQGDYVALLDADDEWEPQFLEEIAGMIEEFPDCGLYCTAFNIISHEGVFPARCPSKRGIVENFFRDSAHQFIAIPSASCIPKRVFGSVGGFPEGMKMAGDLYMWIKIAQRFRVCFSPKRLLNYSRVASNRSASSYTPENTPYSFEDLYDKKAPTEQNEFVARAALGKALVICTKGGTEEAQRAVKFFAYTKEYRRTWLKVKWLSRLPIKWRPRVMAIYDWLAWKIAKKGL